MSDLEGQLRALLELVHATDPREIDCDEFLERVAGVVDALGADAAPPPELDAVSQHLTVCPECREEFDALVRTLGS